MLENSSQSIRASFSGFKNPDYSPFEQLESIETLLKSSEFRVVYHENQVEFHYRPIAIENTRISYSVELISNVLYSAEDWIEAAFCGFDEEASSSSSSSSSSSDGRGQSDWDGRSSSEKGKSSSEVKGDPENSSSEQASTFSDESSSGSSQLSSSSETLKSSEMSSSDGDRSSSTSEKPLPSSSSSSFGSSSSSDSANQCNSSSDYQNNASKCKNTNNGKKNNSKSLLLRALSSNQEDQIVFFKVPDDTEHSVILTAFVGSESDDSSIDSSTSSAYKVVLAIVSIQIIQTTLSQSIICVITRTFLWFQLIPFSLYFSFSFFNWSSLSSEALYFDSKRRDLLRR